MEELVKPDSTGPPKVPPMAIFTIIKKSLLKGIAVLLGTLKYSFPFTKNLMAVADQSTV
jgi:hypothetical protein